MTCDPTLGLTPQEHSPRVIWGHIEKEKRTVLTVLFVTAKHRAHDGVVSKTWWTHTLEDDVAEELTRSTFTNMDEL